MGAAFLGLIIMLNILVDVFDDLTMNLAACLLSARFELVNSGSEK